MVHQQKIRVAYLAPEGEAIPEDSEQFTSMLSDTADLSVSTAAPYFTRSVKV